MTNLIRELEGWEKGNDWNFLNKSESNWLFVFLAAWSHLVNSWHLRPYCVTQVLNTRLFFNFLIWMGKDQWHLVCCPDSDINFQYNNYVLAVRIHYTHIYCGYNVSLVMIFPTSLSFLFFSFLFFFFCNHGLNMEQSIQ